MNKLEFLREEGHERWWRYVEDGTPIKKPPRAERIPVYALAVSDIHFNFPACRARALLATLNTFWIERYAIVVGDAVEGSPLKPLTNDEWKVLRRLYKMGDPERDAHVEDIWVEGNHDWEVINTIAALFRFSVYSEFKFKCGGKIYLPIHGHQWDEFVSKRPVLTRCVIWAHGIVQKIDPQNRHLLRFASQLISRWRRDYDRVAQGAAAYGKQKGVDYVICGHVHRAEWREFDGITYINDGCWTQDECAFVTITEAGPILNHLQLS